MQAKAGSWLIKISPRHRKWRERGKEQGTGSRARVQPRLRLHTSSSRAAPSKDSIISTNGATTGDQVFKCMSLWGAFSMLINVMIAFCVFLVLEF